ncbi:MAG: hypothetical protein JWN00_2307, partial [Actinomycetia bacterium]|nr:hypothetical protein [Actinomycetes bacterium]
ATLREWWDGLWDQTARPAGFPT